MLQNVLGASIRGLIRQPLLAVTAFALASAAHGAIIPIADVTINDGTNNLNIPVDTTSFQDESTVVDFTAGGTTYSTFGPVSAYAPNGSPSSYTFGDSAGDPGSHNVAILDNRIDTSGFSVPQGSEFEFASAPSALLDVLFIFDLGSLDPGVSIELIDAADALVTSSNSVSLINMMQIAGSTEVGNGGTSYSFNGIAITFDEFGITAGQLASVDGFRVIGASSLDLNLAGIGD